MQQHIVSKYSDQIPVGCELPAFVVPGDRVYPNPWIPCPLPGYLNLPLDTLSLRYPLNTLPPDYPTSPPIPYSVADPGFSPGGGGANSQKCYYFSIFSRKLHENERIWTPRGGARPWRPPLDPPMLFSPIPYLRKGHGIRDQEVTWHQRYSPNRMTDTCGNITSRNFVAGRKWGNNGKVTFSHYVLHVQIRGYNKTVT